MTDNTTRSEVNRKRLAGLGLVALMCAPGALIYVGSLWPMYTAIGLLAVLIGGGICLALFVWPHMDEW